MFRKKILAAVFSLALISAPATASAVLPADTQSRQQQTNVSSSSDYYPPLTHTLTHSQVTDIYNNIQQERAYCYALNFVLPDWVICTSSPAMQEAVIAAYHNNNGLRLEYYIHKGVTSLNYYNYVQV